MKAIEVAVLSEDNNGARVVRAIITSDTVPTEPPTSGEGITGLRPSDTFAPMSAILCINDDGLSIFLADNSGAFKEI